MEKCTLCGREMEEGRKELGIYHCKKCSSLTKQKGVMEYDHKTAGVLVVCSTETEFRELKKAANRRR